MLHGPSPLYLTAILFSLLISHEDCRERQISLLWIIGFGMISLFLFFRHLPDDQKELRLLSLLITFLLLGGIFIVERLLNKSILGLGDKILFPLCVLWFPTEDLPSFLIIVGGISTLIGKYLIKKKQELPPTPLQIPLTPALFIGLWGIVFWNQIFYTP